MTKQELDTIDYRADKEILEIYSCAVAKYQLQNKRVPKRLKIKHLDSITRFSNHLAENESFRIEICVKRKPNGKPDFSSPIRCTVHVMEEAPEQRTRRRYIDDDDDDDDD